MPKKFAPRPEAFIFEEEALRAATTSDNLGTLAGTLVTQRALELYAYEFPILANIATDFSAEPAQWNQTNTTRIISVPSVQEYVATVTNGRPAGWSTAVNPTSTDASITLDKHVGIPLVFDANALSGTMRRLFDEFAPASAYALGKYMVDKLYALFLATSYNAYATKGAKVPTAYSTFKVALAEMTRGKLTELSAAFNTNEVPMMNRALLLNCQFYAKLANDPSLAIFFASQGATDLVTMNRLPKIATFVPIEAPNLPTTGGMVGFALHRAAAIIKGRLPINLNEVFGGDAGNGSVVTLTEPRTGLSVLNVQYVSHKESYAESRLEVLLGADEGDTRGGLVLTAA